MENDITADSTDTFCSTTEAARLLGVSVGTVQQMVESGKLRAWKTGGGHRRISMQSVQHQRQHASVLAPATAPDAHAKLQVMIVEDDDFMRSLYQRELDALELPLTLELYDNGLEAMLRLGAGFPHLLILDLEIPYIDGFEMLKRIKAHQPQDIQHIIVVSGLDDAQLSQHQSMLAEVTLLKKPFEIAVLKGYLLALRQIYL